MDELLQIEVAVSHMAELLTEVFTGGPELCLKVKEEQIEQVFEKITKTTRTNPECVPELTTILQAIAKVIYTYMFEEA